jgi:hypothetical protein
METSTIITYGGSVNRDIAFNPTIIIVRCDDGRFLARFLDSIKIQIQCRLQGMEIHAFILLVIASSVLA